MTPPTAPTTPLKVRCPGCNQKLDLTGLAPFAHVFCPTCGGKLTVPMEFGGYLLEEMLAAGAQATVYRALDRTLDREVAVKTLGDRLRANPAAAARYLEAARRAAVITHPGLIPIYACDDTPAHPYLVMQYMGGLSLARALEHQHEGLPVAEAVHLFAAVTGALAVAAHHQLLHLDLHPGNLLFDGEGGGRVGDFGLARALWDPQASLAVNLHACYRTTRYLSPEQLHTGQGDLRSDIFSLGAVMFHALTGRPPFAAAHADGTRDPAPAAGLNPVTRRPELPAALGSLVAGMLAEAPGDRPQLWAEVEGVLNTLDREYRKTRRSGHAPGAKPGGRPTKRLTLKKPKKDAAKQADEPGLRPVRHPWRAPLAVLLVAVAAGVLITGAGLRLPWYTRAVEPWLNGLFNPDAARSAAANHRRLAAPPPPPAAADGENWLTGDTASTPPPAETATPGDTAPATAATTPPDAATAIAPPENAAPPPVITGPDGRPLPADLDFFREKDALKQYVRDLSPADKRLAIEKIREISILRDYLIRLFKFNPFEDQTRQGIRLRDGTLLHGTVMGNPAQIIIRPANGKFRRLAWHELDFDQFPVFFDYYIGCRLGLAAAGPRGQDIRRDAAADNFRVALLCDWYGRADQAASHARRAVELDPTLKERLQTLLPGTVP